MADLDEDLRRRWEALTGVLLVDEAESMRVLRDLWRRHDEPHRVYHRLSHVRHVLEVIDLVRSAEGLGDPIALQIAAWFHHAVQDPQAGDSAGRSADLVVETLGGWGLQAERIAHIGDLVRATALRTCGHEGDTAVLVDAERAILAADPDTYEVYRRALRVEHAALDEAAWCAGRGRFLEGMLALERVFCTDTMARRGERAARANLSGELESLRG